MKKGKKIIALSAIILAMAVAGIACQKNTITEDIDPIGSETETSMEFVEATDSEELKETEKETKNKETSKAEAKKGTEDKKKETKETEKKSDNNKKETVVKETSKKEENETKPQKPSTSEKPAVTKPQETEKPAETKPTRPPETKPQEPEKPAETQHQHHWVEQTRQVKHEAEGHYETVVVKEAWDEPIYESHNFCSDCGKNVGNAYNAGLHLLESGHNSYYAKRVQVGSKHHDAVTEKKWVQDKAAWTETIVVGYKCSSCGDTKK